MPNANAQISLQHLGTYYSGIFDEGAAEICSYDAASMRLFVTNSDNDAIDVLDLSDPTNPTWIDSFDISNYGGGVNSVAVKNGIVAAAVENDSTQLDGVVVFWDTLGNFIATMQAGALPDMLIWTPSGNKLLVANEGEPSDDYGHDPEGSVTVIDVSGGVAGATVKQAYFRHFNAAPIDPNIRIFGPGASVAEDLEP